MQVLLLDEVTVDLDVVTRLDFLDFLREECEEVSTDSITLHPMLSRNKSKLIRNFKKD